MRYLQPCTHEALGPPAKPETDKPPGHRRRAVDASSDSDGSASIDQEDISGSGSDDFYRPARRGCSRKGWNKCPFRKRRKRPEWTRKEEETLAQAHCSIGNQWSAIASKLTSRTANEVKNIWHSTLRSKHLKARSLLRTYATALNGRWDDEESRQEAYRIALRLHDADPVVQLHGHAVETPWDCIEAPKSADASQQEVNLANVGTFDGCHSPRAVVSHIASAPPTTADWNPANGGVFQHRHQRARTGARPPPSPSTSPAKALGGQIAAYGGSPTVSLDDIRLLRCQSGLVHEERVVPSSTCGKSAVLPSELTEAPSQCLGATLSLPLQHSSILQHPQHEQPGATEQQRQVDNPSSYGIVGTSETLDSTGAASMEPGHGQVLGYEPYDTWIGRVNPSLILQDDDSTARELRSGGAESNSSCVPHAVSMSGAGVAGGQGEARGVPQPSFTDAPGPCGDIMQPGYFHDASAIVPAVEKEHSWTRSGTMPEPGQRLAGPSSVATTFNDRAGASCGAWSSNSSGAGFCLRSLPVDGGYTLDPHAQDNCTPTAVSPAAVHTCGGNLSMFHAGVAAAGPFDSHIHVPGLPYGAPPAGDNTLRSDPSAEGCGRLIAPGGWILATQRQPRSYDSRPQAMMHTAEGWGREHPALHGVGVRPGQDAADSWSSCMVPVHAPPLPALPAPQMIYAAPPHMLDAYYSQLCIDQSARQYRLRMQEHMRQQQQHYLYQQQQLEQQQGHFRQKHNHRQDIRLQLEQQQVSQQSQQHRYQVRQQDLKQDTNDDAPQQENGTPQSQPPQQQVQLTFPFQRHTWQAQTLQERVQQQQQQQGYTCHEQVQQQQAMQQDQHDSTSLSEVVIMGLDSLLDPQLQWCLTGVE